MKYTILHEYYNRSYDCAEYGGVHVYAYGSKTVRAVTVILTCCWGGVGGVGGGCWGGGLGGWGGLGGGA